MFVFKTDLILSQLSSSLVIEVVSRDLSAKVDDGICLWIILQTVLALSRRLQYLFYSFL